MSRLTFLYAKLAKKLRGSAIKNSTVHSTAKIHSGSTLVNVRFGRHSYCGYDCTFLNCEVGAFCSIAGGVFVGGARHPIEYVSTSPVFLKPRNSVKRKYAHHDYDGSLHTSIGNDVWIGENVLIKGGVIIGDGAIIGMGSVVTKDVAPYSIVAGNPARLVRMRFSSGVILALQKMAWWNLPDEELDRLGSAFDDPEQMLRQEGHL